jgi:Zn-dependent protease
MNLNVLELLAFILGLLLAIAVHESAHAWMANFLGDPTAKSEGRISLNPLAHWDPVGTSLLVGLIALRMLGAPVMVFGWGKPVPINPRNFNNPVNDQVKTALAGPASNLIIAIIIGLPLRFIPQSTMAFDFLSVVVYLNLILMIFNLLPIPPLDGSRLISLIVSEETYLELERLALPLMFLIIFVFFLAIPIIPNFIQIITHSIFGIISGKSLLI